MTFRVGIVVGEPSGDTLGAALIRSLRSFYPELTFEGVLGPQLLKEGGINHYPMDRLSVMGLVEPLLRIPELLLTRRRLIKHFIKNPPDVFIGVDAPDFNLNLERALKKKGIPTVHYGCPTVWAWRKGRIGHIKKSVDLMLTLFPFEAKFCEQHQMPVCFTGHPMADEIALESDTRKARELLGLQSDKPVIALLPGSRNIGLKYLAETFLLTARLCSKVYPDLQYVVPLVSEAHQRRFLALVQKIAPHLSMKVIINNARLALAAADAVLVTSGTATLEAMLHKKPMVVAYRMHPLNYQILKRLVKVSHIALPNLLADKRLVPEYIQQDATPETLAGALLEYLTPSFDREDLVKQFNEIHKELKRSASMTAARAIQDKIFNLNQ